MTIPEAALAWAIAIANDQTHGYSQTSRYGPDYDCSSLVLTAYKTAGADIGSATFTGNMVSELTKHGFTDVTKSCDLNTTSGMQAGDILLWHYQGTSGHTALFVGANKIVHARGQSYGSAKTGDQGSEIAVTAYYRGKWTTVLRYTGTEAAADTATSTPAKRYSVTTTLPMIKRGDTGMAVKIWQMIIGEEVDGEFGWMTSAATSTFQCEYGLEVDGIVGPESWGTGLKTVE